MTFCTYCGRKADCAKVMDGNSIRYVCEKCAGDAMTELIINRQSKVNEDK